MSYDFIEQHDGYTISRKFYDSSDPRLGRQVNHDSRSLVYKVQAADPSTLTSIRHPRSIPILDQGSLGSCTGNAGTGNLGTGIYWAQGLTVLDPSDVNKDEKFAVTLYSDATKIDPYRGTYPPIDTGSDGLSIAKVLKSRGLISGYTHATSLEAFLTALSQGPVIVGIEWHENMFNVDQTGHVSITGKVVGGHEIVFDQLDIEHKRVWFSNSWGKSWGIGGRAYLTWDDMATLLAAEGDVTVFVPASQPAPTPTPTPTPDPTPTPTPTPDPGKDVIQEIIDAAEAFIASLKNFIQQL